MSFRLRIDYPSRAAFLAAFDQEIAAGSLTVPRSSGEAEPELFQQCEVELRVPGEEGVVVSGWITHSVPGVGLGVVLGGVDPAVTALAERVRALIALAPPSPNGPSGPDGPPGIPTAAEMEAEVEAEVEAALVESEPELLEPEYLEESEPIIPEPEAAIVRKPRPSEELAARINPSVTARIDGLGATEKMRLAMSGNRDERLALLRDINRVLHVYVLRNPRLGLDEVQYASRLPNLSPEALKLISEHAQWSADPQTCANLARNPKTPVTIAVRMLDRVTPAELRQIARGGARQTIVIAARRKLSV